MHVLDVFDISPGPDYNTDSKALFSDMRELGGRSKYNFFMDSQATERSAISRTIYKYMRLDVFDGYPQPLICHFFSASTA